jgi:hypothetical protein
MNNLLEHLKIMIFSHHCGKLIESFQKKNSLKNIRRRPTFKKNVFENFDFQNTLFSNIVPNFCRLCIRG